MVGKRILHYEIEERLGQGAMGAVYRARDLRLDTVRALKFIRPDLVDDDQARADLHGEARSQAKLLHPNIATLFALESSEEGDFLVQEYVQGPDLATWLKESDPDLEQRLSLLLEVAAALGAAHRSGIIHRDIKPGNVLVTPEGHAKVTDFGLAKALEQHSMSASIGLKGTVPYIPPEVFRGERINRAADVWALGVLAWEMLQGERPFVAQNVEALAIRIMTEPHPPVDPAIESRVEGLSGWLDGCLKKEPSARIPDGEDAHRRLSELLVRAGLSMGSTMGFPFVGGGSRRRRGRAVAGLLVSAGVLLLLAIVAVRPWRWLMSGGPVWEWSGWEATGSERSTSWDPTGTRLAFLVDGPGSQLRLVDTSQENAFPASEALDVADRIQSVRWSPTGRYLALAGESGLYLYDLDQKSTERIVEDLVETPAWSSDGSRILYRDPYALDGQIRSVRPGDGPVSVGTPISVAGLPPPRDAIRLYNPVFIAQDRFIAFVVHRSGDNLGVYRVPAGGGQAEQIIGGEYRPWRLDWAEEHAELLFGQLNEPGLFRQRFDESGRPSGPPRSLVIEEQVSDFDHAPASGRLALVTSRESLHVWSGLLDGDGTMSPLIEVYENTFTPALSRDGATLYFAALDPDAGPFGQQLYEYSLPDGPIARLHPANPRYAGEWYPAPDPVSDRFVVFRAAADRSDGLFYYDRQTQGIVVLRADTPTEEFSQPVWSADGSALYCLANDPDWEVTRIDRLTVDRDGAGLRVIERESILEEKGLRHPSPDKTDRFLLFERQSGSGAVERDSLFVLERKTGAVHALARGGFPALGPDSEEVYFVRGTAILRIGGWAGRSPTDPVQVAHLPVGSIGLGFSRSLAVGPDRLYAILPRWDPGSLLWAVMDPR